MLFHSPTADFPPPVLGKFHDFFPGFFQGKKKKSCSGSPWLCVPRGAVDDGNAGIDGLKDISQRSGSGVVSEQDFGVGVLFLALGASCILLCVFWIPKKKHKPSPTACQAGNCFPAWSQTTTFLKIFKVSSSTHLCWKSLKCCIK